METKSTIKIQLGKREIELTPEEARQLVAELKTILGEEKAFPFPNLPQYPVYIPTPIYIEKLTPVYPIYPTISCVHNNPCDSIHKPLQYR